MEKIEPDPMLTAEWTFQCKGSLKSLFSTVSNFKIIAKKYSAYNIRIDERTDKDAIIVTYKISDGVEIVKEEFDNMLPVY